MMILYLGFFTVWIRAKFPTCRRYMLPPTTLGRVGAGIRQPHPSPSGCVGPRHIYSCVVCVCVYIYMGGQNNGNTKKLRNIICVGYNEKSSWQHWMFFRLFTLCSARVSAFVSDCVEWQPVWKIRKVGDLFEFELLQIVGARLAGASDKNWHIIRCIESDSF
jgi:hypothetical protein